MTATVFDELDKTLNQEGPDAAISRLCARLRKEKDYSNLFYALLMKKRHELGLMAIPTAPTTDLSPATAEAYEEGIRQACREVGDLYLQDGDLPHAWPYFRMVSEPAVVRQALETHQPQEGEDVQALVQIAFYEGIHPQKGFDWILDRFGLCSAITTLGSQEWNHPPEAKQYCLRSLVRALYAELRERLTAEVARHEGQTPPEAGMPADTPGVVRNLMQGRDWLFQDEFYHIDTSHLSSVVQMGIHLNPCPELTLARELCEYGQHLGGRFQNQGDPPFEDFYSSFYKYLGIVSGEAVDEGLAYFREQAEQANPEEVGTYPAEVYINLLLRVGRREEALKVARKYLSGVTDSRQLTCPGVRDLCQQAEDYGALAEVSKEQGDAVHYLAGLLQARKKSG